MLPLLLLCFLLWLLPLLCLCVLLQRSLSNGSKTTSAVPTPARRPSTIGEGGAPPPPTPTRCLFTYLTVCVYLSHCVCLSVYLSVSISLSVNTNISICLRGITPLTPPPPPSLIHSHAAAKALLGQHRAAAAASALARSHFLASFYMHGRCR